MLDLLQGRSPCLKRAIDRGLRESPDPLPGSIVQWRSHKSSRTLCPGKHLRAVVERLRTRGFGG
jgi:hypothetical protein